MRRLVHVFKSMEANEWRCYRSISSFTNRAGDKQLDLILSAHFQDVMQPLNVHSHSQGCVVLSYGAKQCAEVDYCIDLIHNHLFLEVFKI